MELPLIGFILREALMREALFVRVILREALMREALFVRVILRERSDRRIVMIKHNTILHCAALRSG